MLYLVEFIHGALQSLEHNHRLLEVFVVSSFHTDSKCTFQMSIAEMPINFNLEFVRNFRIVRSYSARRELLYSTGINAQIKNLATMYQSTDSVYCRSAVLGFRSPSQGSRKSVVERPVDICFSLFNKVAIKNASCS